MCHEMELLLKTEQRVGQKILEEGELNAASRSSKRAGEGPMHLAT